MVGRSVCSVVDTYWQTETGGHLLTPLPAVTPAKPGSCCLPMYGIEPVLLDATTGVEIDGNDVEGTKSSVVWSARPTVQGAAAYCACLHARPLFFLFCSFFLKTTFFDSLPSSSILYLLCNFFFFMLYLPSNRGIVHQAGVARLSADLLRRPPALHDHLPQPVPQLLPHGRRMPPRQRRVSRKKIIITWRKGYMYHRDYNGSGLVFTSTVIPRIL